MNGYKVSVKKAQEFIAWAVKKYSVNAKISFEGCFPMELFDIPGRSTEPNEILKRQTSQPRTSFLIFPLEPDTTNIIIKSVLTRIGLRRNVYHIQIEKEGRLVFGVYDNLQHVALLESVSQDEISALNDSGVICSLE